MATTVASPALAEALASVGDRWTLLLVAALMDGARRFADLERDVEGIAPNVLTARLRLLEELGLVVAQPYCERPPRFAYELTESGRGLAGPLRLLADWGARHGGGSRPLVHAACGTPLDAVWFCATCEQPVPEEDAGELDYA